MAALAAVWVIAGTRTDRMYGDTLNSRLATAYALVHEHTFVIARPGERTTNPFADFTVDKVQFGDAIVSSKPPLLPLMMAAEYALMRAALGWDLGNPADVGRIAWVMTVTLVGAPFVAIVWSLVWTVRRIASGIAPPVFTGAAVLISTHASAYAVIFNNHVPAAAGVTVCFASACALHGRDSAGPRWLYLAFGLGAGIAATVDVPVAIFPALLGLALARDHLRPLIVWAMPVALFLLAVQTVALALATGSPLPAQLHADAYLYESSYWRNPLGIDAINDPFPAYLFHITFGRAGVFSLFPITLLAIPGALLARRAGSAASSIAWCGAAGAAVLALYYAWTTNNYGGSAFGFRWFIVLGPVFLLMSAPFLGRLQRPWHWIVPAALLAVSAHSAYTCVREPWQPNREWTVRLFGPSI